MHRASRHPSLPAAISARTASACPARAARLSGARLSASVAAASASSSSSKRTASACPFSAARSSAVWPALSLASMLAGSAEAATASATRTDPATAAACSAVAPVRVQSAGSAPSSTRRATASAYRGPASWSRGRPWRRFVASASAVCPYASSADRSPHAPREAMASRRAAPPIPAMAAIATVREKLPRTVGSAPRSSRSRTTPAWSRAAAHSRAVRR